MGQSLASERSGATRTTSLHHCYTNILGKDRDFGYGGLLRLSANKPGHRPVCFQPLTNRTLGIMFQWGVGMYELEWDRCLSGEMSATEFKRRATPFVRKAAASCSRTTPCSCTGVVNAPRVLVGNSPPT